LLLDGWGIHMSVRGGWVWNIWGRDCVVIHLDRSTLRVGTDDAENLTDFLKQRTGMARRVTTSDGNRMMEGNEPTDGGERGQHG
jgi:hypothetical protein